MTDLVEKLAEALWSAKAAKETGVRWEKLWASEREEIRAEAVEAIGIVRSDLLSKLREPSEELLEAAWGVMGNVGPTTADLTEILRAIADHLERGERE